MNRILTSILTFSLFVFTLGAQTADQVFLSPSGHSSGARMCMNDAGNIQSFGPHVGQSNDVAGDTIYLCLGDNILINHANDEILTSDPDMSTAAGVGYTFFNCIPDPLETTTVADIASSICITNVGSPTNGFYVYTGGVLTGDVLFFNDGNLQTALNGGSPAIYHFAPITFDEMDLSGLAGYEGNPVGDCVHVSDDQLFSVAYLNEIIISELSTSGCSGSFRARGGLSELDNSDYIINIFLQSNPSVTATISSGPNDHDDIITFTTLNQVPILLR